ncbi:hypothetical protein BH20ACT19_BH20ACT19_10400 [soil metagenome]
MHRPFRAGALAPAALAPAMLALSVLALAVLALLPAAASASSRQLSILQDERVLVLGANDPERAMAEAKALGVDVVRAFVIWNRVTPRSHSEERPERFDAGDPDSPGYDWSVYDAFVERARRHRLKVFLTLSPPLPRWASEEPGRCPHFIGGYRDLGKSCYWKPKAKEFGQFAQAVARRYRGRVSMYSIWNEPNLEHYLYPQLRASTAGPVDVAAKRYRRLWYQGWSAIARHDPALYGKVLFGEVAAISSPIDTLYAALCLDPEGRPFTGRMRRMQGCVAPRRLPIGGIAVHPYNKDATGTVFERPFTTDSLPMSALYRVHDLAERAARLGRIPRSGRDVYVTEFGFQSSPPDRELGLNPTVHARTLNESERLFARDPRVKSVAQFELYDEPDVDVINSGLHYVGGRLKPAWRAYRMPLVVSRAAGGAVEVWGRVRPAPGRARPTIVATRPGGRFRRVRRPLTNRSGIFRVIVRRPGAQRLRYQLRWRDRSGEQLRSRVARAGRPIRYQPERSTE